MAFLIQTNRLDSFLSNANITYLEVYFQGFVNKFQDSHLEVHKYR